MTAPIYNTIGHHYRTHRAADRRIVNQIIALMAVPQGSVVCDVGAGAGNYANALADPPGRWCGSGQEMPMNTLSAAGIAFSFGVV